MKKILNRGSGKDKKEDEKVKRIFRICAVFVMTAVLLTTPVFAADWPQFLGEEGSRGVSDGKAPRSGAELGLRWQRLTGTLGEDGVMTHTWCDVPGTPIVVGDYVYYYSSQYIRKMELATGKEVCSAPVYGEPVNQFFIDIAYGDGKIFVPCQTNNLNDGIDVTGCFFRVYDADTLKQLYVTESIGKGQMQSPVIYHDGYFITGTYGRNGVYACFTSKDEDTSRDNEIKKATWISKTESKFAYTFAGGAFVGEYCYFACENKLRVVKYKTGEEKIFELPEGYVTHSTITYSDETDRLYVASNHPSEGTSILAYKLKSNGMPDASSALEWISGTEGGGTQSTPVIYNGRLYIGGGGYTMGSAEPFHVIDAATMKEIYSVPILTKGSAGISTAYATAENNYKVYIYMVPYAPVNDKSQMWIITDSQGQTKAEYEIVDGVGVRQYCSQSVIVAHDGSLLWYNDAARIYCYENKTLKKDGTGTSGETSDLDDLTGIDGNAADKNNNGSAGSGVFSDTKNHWAKEKIAFLTNKGIINGTSADKFSPNDSITRAQFAQILAKMSAEDLSDYQQGSFTDVKASEWYAPAVNWAAERGIAAGSNGKFSPNAKITRQDMAVMLQRYMENVYSRKTEATIAKIEFTDETMIAAYAKDAVTAMQTRGIISGIADGSGYRFEPTASATRAQAAVMIANLYQTIYNN